MASGWTFSSPRFPSMRPRSIMSGLSPNDPSHTPLALSCPSLAKGASEQVAPKEPRSLLPRVLSKLVQRINFATFITQAFERQVVLELDGQQHFLQLFAGPWRSAAEERANDLAKMVTAITIKGVSVVRCRSSTITRGSGQDWRPMLSAALTRAGASRQPAILLERCEQYGEMERACKASQGLVGVTIEYY